MLILCFFLKLLRMECACFRTSSSCFMTYPPVTDLCYRFILGQTRAENFNDGAISCCVHQLGVLREPIVLGRDVR